MDDVVKAPAFNRAGHHVTAHAVNGRIDNLQVVVLLVDLGTEREGVDVLDVGTINVLADDLNQVGIALKLDLTHVLDSIDMIDDELYPHVNEKLCIGCGACREISLNDFAIDLDRYIGPIIHSRNIEVNHESCVNCYLCEENCPTGAIELVDGEVVLDNDKCIRCIECTNHCPVGALNRVKIE